MNWTSRRFFLRLILVVGVFFLLTLVTLTLVSYNVELLRPQDISPAGNLILKSNICIVQIAHLLDVFSFCVLTFSVVFFFVVRSGVSGSSHR